MAVKNTTEIPRAKTPESVGVDSREVQAFIDHCMELGKEVHSLIVMRHGKIACEIYREPFGPDRAHAMYSVSKSFTSTAIGFAIAEGLIALDTRFVDIFPEARGDKPDPYLEKLCVEDLLTMRSGLSVTPMMDKTKDRWFKDIISSSWISEPGTKFDYISENMYLLCCIIHKKAGMSVVDYLTPRLFEPLGIERPFWETDPRGIEAGGWGLMLKSMDLAKFTLLYQQGGKWHGKQILPEGWAETATAYHTASRTGENSDSSEGYGYCFWRNGGYKKSYRADGMFSQFGIVFEDLDACLAFTGGEVNEQAMRDVIWAHFPKAFIDDDKKAKPVELSIPAYEKLPARPRTAMEKRLIGKRIVFNKPILLNVIGYPVSVAPLTLTFMGKDKAGNITNVQFLPQEDTLKMTWSEGGEVNSIHIGMDGAYRWDNITLGQMPLTACSVGCWNNETELEILIRPIESVAARRLVFRFNGDRVTLKPSAVPSTAVMAENLARSVKNVFKSELLAKPLESLLPRITPLVDMVHFGKLK